MIWIKILAIIICVVVVLEIATRIFIDPYAPDSKDEE